MYRSLVSAAVALSLLVSSFISPVVTYARRCPDEPPSTLLSLYKKSDAIFVGTFDKTTVGDVVSEDEHSTMVNASDHYSISSTLKGTTQKFFVNTYEQYHYKGSEGTEEIADEEGYGVEKVEPGDTVILFLKFKSEDEENKASKPELGVVHYRDAIRPVKASEISSYEARIKDLNGIFSSKKADDADILKWILRCIDDPVTRWDGAFELLTSFQNLEWKKEQEKQAEKEAEEGTSTGTEADDQISGEKIEASDERSEESHETEPTEEEEFDNTAYAALLTPEQKDELTNIALNLTPDKSENNEDPESKAEKPTLDEGERVLFELVKRWGDSRLAAAMLDRLRLNGEDIYQKMSWMTLIAEVLKDTQLSSLGEKYSEISYRENDETVEVEKTESKKSETNKGEVKELVSETVPVMDDTSSDVHDGPPKKTFGMLRDELLAQFIDRAQVVLTQEQDKNVARAK